MLGPHVTDENWLSAGCFVEVGISSCIGMSPLGVLAPEASIGRPFKNYRPDGKLAGAGGIGKELFHGL